MLIPFSVEWWRKTHSLIRSGRSVSSFPWRCSRWSLVWKTGLSISDSSTASSQLLLKHVMNVLMALRVSWGIQLMSTSFIPPMPFSTFRGIRFLCMNMKHMARFWLSNIWNLKKTCGWKHEKKTQSHTVLVSKTWYIPNSIRTTRPPRKMYMNILQRNSCLNHWNIIGPIHQEMFMSLLVSSLSTARTSVPITHMSRGRRSPHTARLQMCNIQAERLNWCNLPAMI